MILPIELSAPGVWPRDRAVMVRKRVIFRPSAATYQSASFSRKAPSLMAEPPTVSVWRASSMMVL